MKFQILFSLKYKKKYFNMSSAENLTRLLNANYFAAEIDSCMHSLYQLYSFNKTVIS